MRELISSRGISLRLRQRFREELIPCCMPSALPLAPSQLGNNIGRLCREACVAHLYYMDSGPMGICLNSQMASLGLAATYVIKTKNLMSSCWGLWTPDTHSTPEAEVAGQHATLHFVLS
ncbi:hypothetical protein XELAEV_18004293mg [Xenopus laevis]|uniref:Uncharacterized protein n=1 Tax=Xenopus laevis TaxID=8355 RepID=A0A974GZS2_XENLA|nr:hypothetical protein XELAEV_18004293mg [Xenopus laevis]